MINSKEQIIKYFESGIKETKDFRIGIEHEKFLFNNQDNKRVDYSKIKEMFSSLLEFGWNPILEKGNIIGLNKGGKNITLEPGNQIELSGDKSISHRLLMYAAITKGDSILHNISLCDDVLSTIEVLRACNIRIDIKNTTIVIKGGTLKSPNKTLNMGNSGTSARLFLGLLVGQNIKAKIIGDQSLSNLKYRYFII